ncbi:hypothetical protein HBB16_12430 [Pseudonocardia sp. MCCB 268]|nr:hypothetical protein [Pseudonocardia cytotoxica]
MRAAGEQRRGPVSAPSPTRRSSSRRTPSVARTAARWCHRGRWRLRAILARDAAPELRQVAMMDVDGGSRCTPASGACRPPGAVAGHVPGAGQHAHLRDGAPDDMAYRDGSRRRPVERALAALAAAEAAEGTFGGRQSAGLLAVDAELGGVGVQPDRGRRPRPGRRADPAGRRGPLDGNGAGCGARRRVRRGGARRRREVDAAVATPARRHSSDSEAAAQAGDLARCRACGKWSRRGRRPLPRSRWAPGDPAPVDSYDLVAAGYRPEPGMTGPSAVDGPAGRVRAAAGICPGRVRRSSCCTW